MTNDKCVVILSLVIGHWSLVIGHFPSMSDPALIDEVQRLREQVRELEGKLITEQGLQPGVELPYVAWQALLREGDVYLSLLDRQGAMLFLSHTDPAHPLTELLGKSVFEFIPPSHQAVFRDALERVFRDEAQVCVEAESVRGGWYANHLGPLRIDGRVVAACNFSQNVTNRRETERLLRESESRWRSLAESVPDSVVVFSPQGYLLYANRLRNRTPEQAQRMHYLEFVLPEYRDKVRECFERVLHTGKSSEVDVQDAVEQNWYLSRLGPLRSGGKVVGVISVARNISDRKQREEQIRQNRDELERRVNQQTEQLKGANRSLLKERRVLQRLLDLHDRDRQLVAYEIHDGMVQDMTGALMVFDAASDAIRQKGGQAAEHYSQALQSLRTSIQEARRLIDGLRPPVLEEYGLIDAIGNHIQELHDRHGIEVDFDHDVQFERLSPTVERAMYRIVQESLNNLALHSGTDRAEVSLRQKRQHVEIVIRDWGHGFDPDVVKPKRFGLLSIRDRARLLGGDASITSREGHGTTVSVTLPMSDVLIPESSWEDADHPPPH
jgi:PAS domain S-box-containing protein